MAGQDTTLDVANFQADSTLDFASATIDWGDGSAETPGVINHDGSTDALSDTGDITGEHTYSQPGTYTIVVTAQESGSVGSGHTATVTSTATVSGVINPGPVLSPTVVQGVAFDALHGRHLHDPAPQRLGRRFHGDDRLGGQQWDESRHHRARGTSPWLPIGTVVESRARAPAEPRSSLPPVPPPIPFPTAAFAVTGGHTYNTSGTFTATITISDTSGDSATTTADITVASGSLVVQPTG